MKRKINCFILCSLFFTLCLLFTACFSPWEGDEGTFSISFAAAPNNRAVITSEKWEGWNESDHRDMIMSLTHTITLSGGPGPEQSVIVPPGTLTANFTVTPGRWDILIIAYHPEDVIVAKGSASIEIKPGLNGPVSINMEQPEPEYDI